MAVPGTLFAGGYGNTAVKDASVGNGGASGATVFCQRIDADVPERLAADMDCGGAAVATPRRRGVRGFFAGILNPNGPRDPGNGTRTSLRKNASDNDDGDGRNKVVTRNRNPDGDTPVASIDDTPTTGGSTPPTDDNPRTAGTTTKNERLSELGVSLETVHQQSEDFQREFQEKLETSGSRGDWSDFRSGE